MELGHPGDLLRAPWQGIAFVDHRVRVPSEHHADRLRPRVFVYGTLRRGSWNHDEWLAPWLERPTEPAVLHDHALHTTGGLPYVVPALGGTVQGELATFVASRYDDGIAALDRLEDAAHRHLDRVAVRVDDGDAWVYVAGPDVRSRLDESTRIPSGDWFDADASRP
jgi:gamma-glutamylcyclotransferase (GGCT)/AIG2-like uncharacterized protein YtfP